MERDKYLFDNHMKKVYSIKQWNNGIKLYLDDIRIAPDGWYTVRSYEEFIDFVAKNHNDIIFYSLDHDLADTERWADIPGYIGIYKVSTWGRIKRISYTRGTKAEILIPNKNESGLYVTLRNKGDDTKVKIHRIVASVFLPTTNNKHQVNHKDGNRWNNHISNLEWVTQSKNIKHSHDVIGREYTANFFIPEPSEKTGYDCAKWLVENDYEVNAFAIHSMNPIGGDNIIHYLNNWQKFNKQIPNGFRYYKY